MEAAVVAGQCHDPTLFNDWHVVADRSRLMAGTSFKTTLLGTELSVDGVITLFVQPVDKENCIAHPYLCYLMDGIDAPTVRGFMQLIFAQDKPILENQVPKRLPLDPRAETPIRADATAAGCARELSLTARFLPGFKPFSSERTPR